MPKPSDPAGHVDREVPTPRESGSFMIFHARAGALLVKLQDLHTPLADALRRQARAIIEECESWPLMAPADVTERLARTTAVYERLRELEAQVTVAVQGKR